MNIYIIKSALADALCVKEDSLVIQELFTRYVTPYELMDASVSELTSIKGVGPVTARRIVSTLKLARALNTPQTNPLIIRSPKDVFELMRFEVGHRMVEEFWLLPLNSKNHVICRHRVSIGTLDSTLVHPRDCYRFLIQRAAASWIALHNHPSGDCSPSDADLKLTNRLAEAGELLGIQLIDHIITSTDSYVSLKERGLF